MMINNVNLKKLDIRLTSDTNHRSLNLLSASSSEMATTENRNSTLQYALSQHTPPILNKYKTLSSFMVADGTTRDALNFKSTLNSQMEKKPQDDYVREQQHVHMKLQNNGWNYHNFCRFYKNHTNNNSSTNNNMHKKYSEVSKNIATHNDVESQQQLVDDAPAPLKRTEDQENAFRLIEDVHNYAKLNQQAFSESSSTETSRSSPNRADDDDEKTQLRYLSSRKDERRHYHNNYDNEDVHVDVETVPKEEEMVVSRTKHHDQIAVAQKVDSPPDHHARRPMNAFLIFCKRHRAIVKDRYKSLENRAITKILGDWWASLEANDKQYFTDLAQQNKDAFFSANPNFKWYKLPAPPLRTLQTRPTPTNEPMTDALSTSEHNDNKANNYFKFADETQMGDLNALLLYDKTNKKKLAANKLNGALQQALGETKTYLNMHVQVNGDGGPTKRHFNVSDTSSLSSSHSSSGDDFIPKKKSRSCKGKKYQELMQSGQITTTIMKKTKDTLSKGMPMHDRPNFSLMNANNIYEDGDMISSATAASFNLQGSNGMEHRMSKFMDGSSIFDLEEKIKELPALNLDEYLQRKRNVKKKRKVQVNKKKNIKNAALKSNINNSDETNSHHIYHKNNNNNIDDKSHKNNGTLRTMKRQERNNPSEKMVVAVVGSQKRKARKESITRRDVSIADNEEVTAVLPMNNTRNYFHPVAINCAAPAGISSPPLTYSTDNDDNLQLMLNNAPIRQRETIINNDFDNNNNKDNSTSNKKTTTISPTSDLLILAEVAVNRTQCSEN